MEDTTPEIEQKFRELLMSRTEEERFLMCAEMFETAKELAAAEMPENLSELERRRFIYEKIYKEPFPI